MKIIYVLISLILLLLCGCNDRPSRLPSVNEELWGSHEGKTVKLFTLKNSSGVVLKVTNYGATITYLSVPDRNDTFEPVILGFDSLSSYVAVRGGFGSVIGRYANRIGEQSLS
jgi:aldose 1-epimerase